jgi:predicted Rossmann fold nucleotide-binding protein DprA/Smf involved in DNA uptake
MLTERTKSILLFTSYFAKGTDSKWKPLSVTEWNRFVRWLQAKDINPEDFLTQDLNSLLIGWQDKVITKDRIFALLDRKPALALALDKWIKVGIWIINRGDVSYPKKLKERLKENVPPILFGIGNKELLNLNYIGVVGSRKTNEKELQDTKELGYNICIQGYGVVSGGARGVDENAMLGALEANGNSVGFVADSLINKSTSNIFRKYIMDGKLALVSPYNPETGFNVGNAMSRNKLIYCQSLATIIVKSDIKGGTWEGAIENIKQNWVPIWVLKNTESEGNAKIVKLGANWLPNNLEFDINSLITTGFIKHNEPNLFFRTELKQYNSKKTEENIGLVNESIPFNENEIKVQINEVSFFELFILKLKELSKNKAVTKKEIIDQLQITNSQLEEWLRTGIETKAIIKTDKPVAFIINPEK